MESARQRIVRGLVRLPGDLASGSGTLNVQVEDISRADAPSTVIAEMRLASVSLVPGGVVEFEIVVPPGAVRERGMYSLRAHLDRLGTGDVTRGDLVSTQTYPLFSRETDDYVEVDVKTV